MILSTWICISNRSTSKYLQECSLCKFLVDFRFICYVLSSKCILEGTYRFLKHIKRRVSKISRADKKPWNLFLQDRFYRSLLIPLNEPHKTTCTSKWRSDGLFWCAITYNVFRNRLTLMNTYNIPEELFLSKILIENISFIKIQKSTTNKVS